MNYFIKYIRFISLPSSNLSRRDGGDYFPARSDMNGLAVIGVCVCVDSARNAWWSRERRIDGAELSAELETVSQSRLKSLSLFSILLSSYKQFILIYRLRITLKIKKYPEFLSRVAWETAQ